MRLLVTLPFAVFLDARAASVKAESLRGHFTVLPRHVDMVTALAPGILTWEPEDRPGEAAHLALNGGILVKSGDEVRIAARQAAGGDLGRLRAAVEEMLASEDERERAQRAAAARMEASFVRGMLEVGR